MSNDSVSTLYRVDDDLPVTQSKSLRTRVGNLVNIRTTFHLLACTSVIFPATARIPYRPRTVQPCNHRQQGFKPLRPAVETGRKTQSSQTTGGSPPYSIYECYDCIGDLDQVINARTSIGNSRGEQFTELLKRTGKSLVDHACSLQKSVS